MCDNGSASDKFSAALVAYQREFAGRIKGPENMDAKKAAALLEEAKTIVGQSGLGAALAPTLLEHVKYWPSWSEREEFEKIVDFPASAILASSDETDAKKKVIGVLFTYKEVKYGLRFTDFGFSSLPDGDAYQSGKVDFLSDGETVLGLDITQNVADEFSVWRWSDLYAFKVGPWTKHLIEIAAHIENKKESFFNNMREEDIISRAKNIKL